MATKVIFRTFGDGDVIALFPQLPGTNNGWWYCLSYMHIGQQVAVPWGFTGFTRPSAEEEYRDLLAELKAIGYDDLVIAKRVTRKDHEIRRKESMK